METFVIMAQALCKASKTMVIERLDIQYSEVEDAHKADLWLGNSITEKGLHYVLHENGSIDYVDGGF